MVSGARPAVVTTIDRKTYSLRDNLQATTGSAADIMATLPSVTVDADGNPSLRGDANVQILIDGRPAPQFNAANRGAALQALGADGVDRIEVLTNPPANFKPDGSAGVINIITKKRPGARNASATASLGSGGRFNLATTGTARLGGLAVHGALTLRHDLRTRVITDDRTVSDATTAAFVATGRQDDVQHNNRWSRIATLGADFDLSAADHIAAEGTWNDRTETTVFAEMNSARDAGGMITGSSDRAQRGHAREINSQAQLRYHHDAQNSASGKSPAENSTDGLTVLVQQSETAETEYFHYRDTYTGTASGPAIEDQRLFADEITRELSIDYVISGKDKDQLTAGYDLQADHNTFDNRATAQITPAAPPLIDAGFTNRFVYRQTIHAVFASYQRPAGRWTLMPGFRVEQVDVTADQVTADVHGRIGYFRVYPNLHLSRALGEHATLSLAYGRRVIRPDPEDLNPYPVQQDAFTVRRGNPALLPEDIQSFEVGWSFGQGATSRSVTAYLRESRNRMTNVSVAISPTVVAITKQNLGHSMAGGAEFATAGRLAKGLDYNLSGNLFVNSIDAANLGFAGTRKALGYEAKAAIDWHAGVHDTLQLNLAATGKRLQPQGYRLPSFGADLGYRHQLAKSIALTATLSDIFATRHDGMVTTSPGLNDVLRRHQTGRIVFLGLTWTPPGAKARAKDKFEYDKPTN